jgi:hypothetical protein
MYAYKHIYLNMSNSRTKAQAKAQTKATEGNPCHVCNTMFKSTCLGFSSVFTCGVVEFAIYHAQIHLSYDTDIGLF